MLKSKFVQHFFSPWSWCVLELIDFRSTQHAAAMTVSDIASFMLVIADGVANNFNAHILCVWYLAKVSIKHVKEFIHLCLLILHLE